MIFRNYTPFPPLHFDSRDENQRDFGVLVLRGTFDILNGYVLRLRDEQHPIVFYDEYYGDPQQSSLKLESSLVPFKPATDFILTASAFSPTGRPESQWNVTAKIGNYIKTLTVTGARRWKKRFGVTTLSEFEPATEVPIRYEFAFGGTCEDKNGERDAWSANPVGRGYGAKNSIEGALAPQIFATEADVHALAPSRPVATAGFGPIAPHWSPRCDQVGTYNEMWRRTRFPDLPDDFQFSFYNCASAGFVMNPFATGTETIELINLTKDRRTLFGLLGFQLATIMRFESGEILPGPVMLDTIHVDAEKMLVHLTWRTVYPIDPSVRVLEVRVRDGFES